MEWFQPLSIPALMLTISLFLIGCVSTEKLFDGEFVVAPDGIYTYAHYYKHPESDRMVIMVGMNHAGDKEYFEKIEEILRPADFVIYEGPDERKIKAGELQENMERETREDLEKMLSRDPNKAFHSAIRSYFRTVPGYLGLISESKAINHDRPHWYVGDQAFFDELSNPEKEKELDRKTETLYREYPPEKKKIVVQHVARSLEKVKEGALTKKDFGDFFILLWSDQLMIKLFSDLWVSQRDAIVFETFDQLLQDKNPHIVGIKFGAGHIPNQRKLLETRGYVHQYSVPLRNIKFEEK